MSVSVRKLIRVGNSLAVVLPPHVLDHIHADKGDFIAVDISAKNFAVISIAPVPPYRSDSPSEPLEIDFELLTGKSSST